MRRDHFAIIPGVFPRALSWLLVCVCAVAAAACAHIEPLPRDDDPASAELPDGDGKKILIAACTTCHGLDEVTKFRSFYTSDDWRDIVTTMVKYGAELKKGEPEALVAYLGQYLSNPGTQ